MITKINTSTMDQMISWSNVNNNNGGLHKRMLKTTDE